MALLASTQGGASGVVYLWPRLSENHPASRLASQHFFIARLPLLLVMQGGASRAIYTFSQTAPPRA